MKWRARRDLNPGSPAPKAYALSKLRTVRRLIRARLRALESRVLSGWFKGFSSKSLFSVQLLYGLIFLSKELPLGDVDISCKPL